jgi:hypothetical protein
MITAYAGITFVTHNHIQLAAKLVPNGEDRMSNRGIAKSAGKRKLRN